MSVRHARKVVSQVKKLQDMMKGSVNPSAEEWAPEMVNIGSLVREAAAFLQPLSPKINLRTHIAADLPETYADPDQIQQMVVNLYDNSSEAFAESPEGEASIDINVLWKPDETSIYIVYADDGPGIPRDVIPHIFDSGFTTKENAEGTGLCECVVVARNHSGEISYRPGQGNGALFSIRIPVVEEPAK